MAYTDKNISNELTDKTVTDAVSFYTDYHDIIFSKASEIIPDAFQQLSSRAFSTWIDSGKRLTKKTDGNKDLVTAFFSVGSCMFNEEGISYVAEWVDAGLRLFDISDLSAVVFFNTTPKFIEFSRYPQLNQWASDAVRVLEANDNRAEAVSGFLTTGAKIQRYLSPRVYTLWKETGFLFSRLNSEVAEAYFSIEPDCFDRLYLSEITKILKITMSAAKESPEKALAFYKSTPEKLLKINPNIRDVVLEKSFELASGKSLISSGRFSSTVGKFSGEKKQAKGITGSFDDIADALIPFSNPIQEKIFFFLQAISDISQTASLEYAKSVCRVLEKLPPVFLGNWVIKGLDLLASNRNRGLRYFQLQDKDVEIEIDKWREAAFLDDLKQVLSVYAHGMSGEKIRVKNEEELNVSDWNELGLIRESDGYSFYLPGYIADGSSYNENFKLYKTAASLKAGYIEFGTLDPQFSGIWILLEKFPLKKLALKIFHIIEDGRIYYQLKKHYRGLAQDLNVQLKKMVDKKKIPFGSGQVAGLEILLRISVGCFEKNDVSGPLKQFSATLSNQFDGFYESTLNVLDSYKKTIEVYQIISTSGLLEEASLDSVSPLAVKKTSDPDDDPSSGDVNRLPDEITDGESGNDPGDFDLSDEELAKLLDSVQDITLISLLESCASARGLYLSDIDNYDIKKEDPGVTPEKDSIHHSSPHAAASTGYALKKGNRYYNEWDYLASEYRSRWCCLREKEILHFNSDLYKRIYSDQIDLIRKVRLQFQRIRPESLNIVRAVDQGDEIDLNALIENRVDKRAGASPSDRIFMRKEKKLRHVSTLLLVDMSASTGENISDIIKTDDNVGTSVDKRVVDIEIESLVVISEALDALGDAYGMYGFSGRGKDEVDFYIIKEFEEPNSESVKMRISGIEPRQSTRMGTAIRHATTKLKKLDSEHRVMLLLSDGFPQDLDYGEDRNSKEYGLADTMMALIEAKREGIRPFCITVDQAGNDYLKKMCDPKDYLIIKDIHMLPEILPGVVESLMCS